MRRPELELPGAEQTALSTSAGGLSAAEAMDLAFAGKSCELVHPDGTSTGIAVDSWRDDATIDDLELFVSSCRGPTLDVGCGPGRLTAALLDNGVLAIGIDISAEAVRQAHARGAAAVRVDVFGHLPLPRLWQHVLLADGNIGLGGDPAALLLRVAALLAPGGSILVELASEAGTAVHDSLRLRVGNRTSATFAWATVGVDAIEGLASSVGLEVCATTRVAGRVVATLRRVPSRP